MLIIGGCSTAINNTWPDTSNSTTNTSPQTLPQQTGVEVCDKYLGVISCLIEENQWSWATAYQELYDNLTSNRSTMPVDQLTEVCKSMTKHLIDHPQWLLGSKCKL